MVDGVVVVHLLVGEGERGVSLTDVDVALVDVKLGVGVEQNKHGGQLEGRPGFDAHAEGEVVQLLAFVGDFVAL